jgi:pyruvate kinase
MLNSEQREKLFAAGEQVDAQLTDPHALLAAMQHLRQEVTQESEELYRQWRPAIQRRSFLLSGQNLAAYLALRQRDLRPLQAALMPWGLSSLGRSESRVLANLDAVIATLAAVVQEDRTHLPKHPPLRTFFLGERLLNDNAEALFGLPSSRRRVRIMVTLPTEAAHDYEFVRDLLQRGMNCVRINCAHDTSSEWEAMIAHVRRADQESGRPCKVLMDLGGPKARTGQIMLPEPKQRLHIGEHMLLTRGTPIVSQQYPVQVECQLPEVLDQLQVGAEVWIDEGKLGTQVEAILPEGLLLRVTHARDKGERLRSDKGLNFPGTELQLSPLTEKDRHDLDFIAHHADIVGYSFVQEAADIDLLQQELRQRLGEQARPLALIAKIETPRAVRNLPELIVHAAGKQPLGVMIARGDLAVEIGYERLAEIQEEMLWVCEAAHVPVIWATQVLENFVIKGTPSRAEMTDAAMAERAECVMLNKGPYVAEAVTILDHVLMRMQDHQVKKTPQLRALHMWQQERGRRT